MIRYSCEISLSCDEAVKLLRAAGIKHKVLGECEIAFRQRPSRRAVEILAQCGFVKCEDERVPPTIDSLDELMGKYS